MLRSHICTFPYSCSGAADWQHGACTFGHLRSRWEFGSWEHHSFHTFCFNNLFNPVRLNNVWMLPPNFTEASSFLTLKQEKYVMNRWSHYRCNTWTVTFSVPAWTQRGMLANSSHFLFLLYYCLKSKMEWNLENWKKLKMNNNTTNHELCKLNKLVTNFFFPNIAFVI